VLTKIQENLDEFAKLGYRTLVLGKGTVTPSFYKEWSERLHQAETQIGADVSKNEVTNISFSFNYCYFRET